jgi:aminopeptidase YwaD
MFKSQTVRYFLTFISFFSILSIVAQTEKEATDNFKKDIQYLSSDALEGRLTGSSGELRSSLYIADEFRMNNLFPYGDSGSFMQKFQIVKIRLSQCRKQIIWTDAKQKIDILEPFVGFYPLSWSCNHDTIDTEVFQAGYGIKAAELNHNDYIDSVKCKGKIFVIQLGHPDLTNPHSKFEPYNSIAYKVDQAIRMGARGIVFYKNDSITKVPSGHIDRLIKVADIPVVYTTSKAESLVKATSIRLQVDIAQLNADAHNVIGMIDNHKRNTIIIGAHQDHLGYNEFGGSRSKAEGQIHNGADDNASGVAMMLQLMRKIKKTKKFKKNNYIFIAFSGEEQGLLGSNYFTKHPTTDLKQVKYMLNFDMLGRLDSSKKTLTIFGVGTSPVWKEKVIGKLKTDTTQLIIKTTESGTGSSDHTSFYLQGIPALHYFTGQHKDYHMPSDDESLINYHGMYLSYQIVLQNIKLVNKVKVFPFTATKNEESTRMNFKVTLGVMLDYAYDGLGAKIDGLSEGRPAEKAGIKAGDIVIKLGNYPINSLQEYSKALGNFNKGDTVPVIVKRGKEEITLNITF